MPGKLEALTTESPRKSCKVRIFEWYNRLCLACGWSSTEYLLLLSFLLLFNQCHLVFFFFSVLMRFNWKNYKTCKVCIMVTWYTDLLWTVNLPSTVLDLLGPKSLPGPSGLAGFSFAVTPSHPRGQTFPHHVGGPTYTHQRPTWRAPTWKFKKWELHSISLDKP